MDTDDLQQLIDRELRALPAPHAPRTLLPRVLAATVLRHAVAPPDAVPGSGTSPGSGPTVPGAAAASSTPWYARPWLAWPHRWQIASVAVLVTLGVAGSMVFVAVSASATSNALLRSLLVTLDEAATLVRIYWRVLLGPLAFLSFVLALSLSLACAAIWLALDRDGIGASQQ